MAAPDGRRREVWGYNGKLPGPAIRAREGELLRIRIKNDLEAPTSVHWHGIRQFGTWTMDGVDGVSRPPIPPGGEFLYEFRAEPSGTHWYHAHVGVQYGEGLFGPLIIAEREPIAAYDREETLILNDWFQESGEALLARLVKPPAMEMMRRKAMPGMGKASADSKMKNMPMSMKPDVADLPFESGLINGKGRATGTVNPPFTVVSIRRGETLRLRLINASSTFALRFAVDGHPLTVIASDGSAVRPLTVDHLTLGLGERYDVLLKGDQPGTHWIQATTLDGNIFRAILRYDGSTRLEPESASGLAPAPVARGLMPELLRAPAPVKLADRPGEVRLVLGGSMMPYRWSINGQYYPQADPIILLQNQPVRFVMENPTAMDHPFHLHGHAFRVLGAPGALNLTDPALKDTVNIPARSTVVLEWVPDNPGRWFFHCHIEWHLAAGMARVIEIKPA